MKLRRSFLKILFFLSVCFGSKAFSEPITLYIHSNAQPPDPAGMAQAGEFVRVNSIGVAFFTETSQGNTYTKNRGIIDSSFLREVKNHINFRISLSNSGTAQHTITNYLELEVKNKGGQNTFKRIATLLINPGQNSSSVDLYLDLSEISPYIAEQREQARKEQERKEREIREAQIIKETEIEHDALLDKLESIFQKTIRPLCFTEGTKIKASTPDAHEVYRDLETIEVGDKVWTCNFDREICELRPVISTSKREVQKIFRITTESVTLEVTGEHPFYADKGHWVEAKKLKVGDRLHTSLDAENKILDIEEISGFFHVYNIEVDAQGSNNQNYFVSDQDILVHNCNLLGGAALVSSGAMLLGGGSVAGTILMLSTGVTVAKVASADTLAEAAEDVAFDAAMAVGLPGLGVAAKHLEKAAGRVLEFGKLVKTGRDKVLDLAKGLRHSAKEIGINGKDVGDFANEVNHLANGKVVDIYESLAKNKPLGLGSTGRSIANNLKEQAAMLVTKADPQKGKHLEHITLTDPRWHNSQGWQKWQTTHKTSEGGTIAIHYVRNSISGKVDDFKFVD